jgi:hypothetical protein
MAYEVELILLYVPLDAETEEDTFSGVSASTSDCILLVRSRWLVSPLSPSGICSNTSGLLLHHLLMGDPLCRAA